MDDAGFIGVQGATGDTRRRKAARGRRNLAGVAFAVGIHAALLATLAFNVSPTPAYEAYEEPAFTLVLAPVPRPPRPNTPERKPAPPAVSRPEQPRFTPREIVTPTALPIPPLPVARPPVPADPSPPPPPREAAPAATPHAAAKVSFQGLVLAKIERARRYPPAARARREEGIATVAFTMTRGGKVSAVQLQDSSGSSLLDREAVETVRRAQPLPPVPDDLEAPLRLVVRLEFFVK